MLLAVLMLIVMINKLSKDRLEPAVPVYQALMSAAK
ncbi:hypothetical protein CECT5772_05943 [Streptococcus equi subsp. ruminatorum CECT 5772]|uniref:Uncharacterized protein n=1 Tax=Streptococcus equi subsp. ruminatorum CECT 5772 TaxID=1051981 RepID=A0A922T664_9STRE|nr:hypothetical protein CECT5772_05943 [Streptococcus equi subsp. ruminatorum CECT 5772]